MFKNALIAVNWSGANADAAALARCLCGERARLTLAHVHAEVPMSPDPLVMALRRFELRQSNRALKGAVFATKIEPTMSVSAPRVSDGLSGLMSMVGADLVVLGPIDRHGAIAAEVADWLTQRPALAPAAVAIASPGFATHPALRRVGVFPDGPGVSDEAVAEARALAASFGGRLKVFETSPRHHRTGPRRLDIRGQRLAEFAARVDVVVSTAPDGALIASDISLLLINRPQTSRTLTDGPAPHALPTTAF